MKPLLAILTLALLPGCVTIPVPPIGNEQQRGSLGNLKISVSVAYIPKAAAVTPATASQSHAWAQFLASKPKLLKDK